MPSHLNPASIRDAFARYGDGIELGEGGRIVLCSGQLGVASDNAAGKSG